MDILAGAQSRVHRPWSAAVRKLGGELGHRASSGRLYTVGTANYEPWHVTAHLQDAARWARLPVAPPILARRRVPERAPDHLAVAIDEVARHIPRCNLLVVAPESADAELLERLCDVRRHGGTVFTLAATAGGASTDLWDLTDELAAVDDVDLELAQHVLPSAFGAAAHPCSGGHALARSRSRSMFRRR